MTGGLLNIVSYGNQNVILNSNPKKSFFKTTYAKYTNFGMQKFRIDFTGQRNLRMSEESRFTFTVPRYAELIMDTYLVVTLPTIWSPIYPPLSCGDAWRPYEFRWIENLGTQMIKEITFSVGGQLLQRMTGKYLLAQVQRDLTGTKRFLYDTMSGSTAELNDPANFSGRRGTYPNVYYNTSQQGPEPSIRGRKLYIPLNAWFCNNSRTAFPLVALQYNELQIDVVMRPVRELFVTRDINYEPHSITPETPLTPAEVAQAPFIQPNFNEPEYQFYRFLQPPPAADIAIPEVYADKRTDWNADVHLLATYCFLSAEESRVFASQEQKYLLKSAYEWDFKNITGSHRVELQNTMGMVATWMFMFQRSDINLRNQWSNYTNWAYTNAIPDDVMPAPAAGTFINPCDIITQTVLDLDYYRDHATTPHNATVVVPATSISQFAIGQTITVTYDANNTITGTIINITGTSISFLVMSVTTNATPTTIYDNSASPTYFTGALYNNYFSVNTPPFNYAGQNYIVQTATCTFQAATPSPSIISFQLIDNTTGTTYNPISSYTLAPAPPTPPTTAIYTYVDCFIENGDVFTLQFTASQRVNWYSVNASPDPSVRYLGTLTGYPVPYSSGVVTVNAELPMISPGVEPDGTPSGLYVTQDYNVENQREILQQLGILLNGSYRENMLESGVYNYVEKYIRTAGSAPFGLYVYNFGMDASNATYQPSGAINMSKFSTIELEFSTYPPPLDPSANFYTICDPNSDPGVSIGVNKPQWRIYQYNYDLTVLEERYNVLTFIGGNCALMYAR